VFKQRQQRCMKRLANKRVRAAMDVADGTAYRKEMCSYDICDYSFIDDTGNYQSRIK
jgi:hypothetical protein